MFPVLRGRVARSAGRLDRPRLVPQRQVSAVVCAWSRQIDLPDGLLLEPVLGLLLNVRLAGGHLYGIRLFTWLSLVMSLMASFCAVLFP